MEIWCSVEIQYVNSVNVLLKKYHFIEAVSSVLGPLAYCTYIGLLHLIEKESQLVL